MSDDARIPELRPEIVFLFELVRQLKSGRIRIPRFQRPYVWRRQQMLDLLDSINHQYPIGSLFAWETDEPMSTLHALGPVQFEVSSSSPVYILDGHQRLMTVAGVLVGIEGKVPEGEDDPGKWRIVYDTREDRFEHLAIGENPLPHQFPMWSILETFDFLSESDRIVRSGDLDARRYVEKAQSLARSFQTYKIPVIRIRDTNMTAAVDVFARLNSKGQAMTADQMVAALLYREGEEEEAFDLTRHIDQAMTLLAVHGFGDVDRTVVLRTLLAAAGEDIYRTDWTQITRNRRQQLLVKLKDALPKVGPALERAATFLRDQFGVVNGRLLPYAMQLVTVAAFFVSRPVASEPQVALLRRWFWWSSFGAWFGGANPSQVNAVVKEAIGPVAADTSSPRFAKVDLSTPAVPIPRSFDMRSARTRAHLLVMLNSAPRDRNGKVIEDPGDTIGLNGPDAVGYVADAVSDRELSRSPANRILRDVPTETGQAKTWLLAVPVDQRDAIGLSHGIPPDSWSLLEQRDASQFVARRLRYLQEVEAKFMQREGVTRPVSDEPSVAPLDAE